MERSLHEKLGDDDFVAWKRKAVKEIQEEIKQSKEEMRANMGRAGLHRAKLVACEDTAPSTIPILLEDRRTGGPQPDSDGSQQKEPRKNHKHAKADRPVQH